MPCQVPCSFFNGDKEHGSSPSLSKALPSLLSLFSSMMCTPHLLCSHSHPHSVPLSSCIVLLYAPSNSPTSLDWFWPYPSCTLGPLVCLQAVTLAKYTSSCCPLSLPLTSQASPNPLSGYLRSCPFPLPFEAHSPLLLSDLLPLRGFCSHQHPVSGRLLASRQRMVSNQSYWEKLLFLSRD